MQSSQQEVGTQGQKEALRAPQGPGNNQSQLHDPQINSSGVVAGDSHPAGLNQWLQQTNINNNLNNLHKPPNVYKRVLEAITKAKTLQDTL